MSGACSLSTAVVDPGYALSVVGGPVAEWAAAPGSVRDLLVALIGVSVLLGFVLGAWAGSLLRHSGKRPARPVLTPSWSWGPSPSYHCGRSRFLPPARSGSGCAYYGLRSRDLGKVGVYAGFGRLLQEIGPLRPERTGDFIGAASFEEAAAFVLRNHTHLNHCRLYL